MEQVSLKNLYGVRDMMGKRSLIYLLWENDYLIFLSGL